MHGVFITLLFSLVLSQAANAEFTLRLRSRVWSPPNDVTRLDTIATNSTPRHVFGQFDDALLSSGTADLNARGVRVLRYVPDHTWILALTPGAARDSVVRGSLRWVGEIEVADKMPPRLHEGRPETWAVDGSLVRLAVEVHDDVTPDRAATFARRLGGLIGTPLAVFPGFYVRLPLTAISTLAAHDDVLWIEESPGLRVAENDGSRAATGAITVSLPPYGLSGAGVRVGMWDDGRVDETHGDFAGRILLGQSAGLSSHATHVAGTLCGSGALSEANGGLPFQWRGVAPSVTLISWDMFGDVIQEMSDGIATHDLHILNNSWGELVNMSNCERFGDYDLETAQFDGLFPAGVGDDLVIVFSAGNERDDGDCPLALGAYGCMNPPKAAKNILVVGAVNSDDDSMTDFSSWGPVDDGRLKPDVVAPGCETGGEGFIHSTLPGNTYGGPVWCGTSMAAPVVSGGAALLWEALAATGHPVPSAAMIKALLVATAVDLGNPGPDFAFGHGRVDFVAAANALRNDSPQRIVLSNGAEVTFDFVVPEGKPDLRFAIAWTDPAGLPMADPALVNDIDVHLVDPMGATVLPWVLDPEQPNLPATRGVDSRNNVEHVTMESPMAGTWTLVVDATSVPVGPEGIAIVGLDTKRPAPVSAIGASARGDTAVALTWTSSTSEDAPGTMLVRAPAKGGTWAGPVPGHTYEVGESPAPGTHVVAIDSLDHSASPFVDEDVAPGIGYRYRAYAFDDFLSFAPPVDTTITVGTPVAVGAAIGQGSFRVHVVDPNPARRLARVRFSLPDRRRVDVRVYTSAGRLVRRIVSADFSPGIHRVDWDGHDDNGVSVAPGVYFVDVRAGRDRSSQRVLWLR